MGLEMLQLQNKITQKMSTSTVELQETNTKLGLGLIVLFVYLFIGAIVFVRIESPMEKIEIEAYQEVRQEWTTRLKKKGFKELEIDKLFANIRDAALNGIWMENNVSSESNWSFGHAFFFSAALVSTVGYGRMPKTPSGKYFTIVYCIVGIPLTLALISALAIRLRGKLSVWLRTKVNIRFGHMFHTKHLQLIHMLFLLIAILIFTFIIPSIFFSYIEDDWSFLDAFFFCFISLTTIGLGDYIPGDKPDQSLRSFYKVIVTIYLIWGLGCTMLLLGTLYNLPQFNLVRFFIAKSDMEVPAERAVPQENEEASKNPPLPTNIYQTNANYGSGYMEESPNNTNPFYGMTNIPQQNYQLPSIPRNYYQ